MPRFPYMNSPFPYYTGRRFSKSYISPSPVFFDRSQNEKTGNHQTVNYNTLQYNKPTQFENTEQRFELLDTSSAPDSVQNSDSHECRFERQKNKSNNNSNDYLFDLFGLKIYTDDVLLVSLIYFLYSEGVKDEGLFIVLILLLLS